MTARRAACFTPTGAKRGGVRFPSTEGPFARLPDRQLEYLGAALTYAVALLHLFHPSDGFGRLVLLATMAPGLLASSPLPVAFVLVGVVLVLAIPLVLLGAPRKPTYVLGMVLMAALVVGYFAWHLTGHGGFLPGREPLLHGLAPHEAVIAHITTDYWAAASVVAELGLFGVLWTLLAREP